MGFFGGKEVLVASTVYSLAGDPIGRPSYLKTLITGQVISNNSFGMTEAIQGGYINGPGMRARSFFRWANDTGHTHYNLIGIPQGGHRSFNNIDMPSVEMNIPVPAGYSAEIIDAHYGFAKASYWAERYLFENHPELIGQDWTSDSDDFGNIIIHLPGTGGDITFAATDPAIDDQVDGSIPPRYFFVLYGLRDPSNVFLGSRLWIYKVGTGNLYMDSLVTEFTLSDRYLPFIPVRIENKFLSETYLPDMYAQAKKGYKKAFSQNLDDLIDQIADNESLEDIDHAYVVSAVSLNTKDNSSKRYLYDFFQNAMGQSPISFDTFSNWLSSQLSPYEAQQTYLTTQRNMYWRSVDGTGDPDDVPPSEDPISVGRPLTYPVLPRTQIAITGRDDTRFKMVLKWRVIQETFGTGLRKAGAKTGEVWIDLNPSYDTGFSVVQTATYGYEYEQLPDDEIIINWQINQDSWKSLRIIGLVHENYAYKDKAVVITAKEALMDADVSGFLVPINYEEMRNMSLIDATQMMTESSYLVLNCYKIVKQKWYQTGFFKVIMFVAIIAVTVATGGAGAIGLLGTAGSVGASLGFTGLTAVIVGAVANAIAAMILMQLIQMGAVAVFGAKLGAIIGAIAGVVAMSVGTGLMNGMSLSSIWGNMMSAPSLIQMTSAVGNGVAGAIQASVQDILAKTDDLIENYNKESKEISELFAQNIGYGRGSLNPMGLTDSPVGNFTETESQFLLRTLMTGSDIAELSMDMLTNFSGYTLSTALPLGS